MTLTALLGTSLGAQEKLQDPPGLEALQYRLIGPAWGGRVSRAAGVVGDRTTYYAATASGGVWKSEDAGLTWKSVFDDQPVSSTGSLAVSLSDPNVIYVGSGEANIRGNVALGNGIYKSTDGGQTWKHVWQQAGQIGTMEVHPTNPDIAYAAVLGNPFKANEERGVYRTQDGGETWEQVLARDSDTGASDLALDPNNPRIIFAGLWQTRRQPWTLTSGGPGSGLYVSRDGGDSWQELRGEGLPEGEWGKVGVRVAPSDGRIVYALIEAEEGGLFRSDDGGRTWRRTSADRKLRQRAWYYTHLTIHPKDADEVWVPQVPMLRSTDGGRKFDIVGPHHHGDFHDLWIDPLDPRRMIAADDGGVYVTTNNGQTWSYPALPIGQAYHVSADSREPFWVAATFQDIGTSQGPSHSLVWPGIGNSTWRGVGGGEAGWVVPDPWEPNIVYAGEFGGYLTRFDHRTGQAQQIGILPDNPSGRDASQLQHRFQWTAPIHCSPHQRGRLYHAAERLFRSEDGGLSWQAISPDLSYDDESKQGWSGGPITGDNTGVETYGTIFAVAESPLQADLIWVGTDDGRVHLTQDGGQSWSELTSSIGGLQQWSTVRNIEPSRFDPDVAYLVADAHRLGDTQPFLWKTNDRGQNWQRLDGDLPRDQYLHMVREDKVQAGMLYLGTERGVALSMDDGRTWSSLRLNLPTVAVHDLVLAGDSLVLGTHGRALWVLDDVAPLRQLGEAQRAATMHLLPPGEAVSWWLGVGTTDRFVAENPPMGARIYYWLGQEPEQELQLEVLDAAGRVVTRLSSEEMALSHSSEYVQEEGEELARYRLATKAGLNRAVWDLSWSGAEMIPAGILDWGYPRVGPRAAPGQYTLRLRSGEQVQEQVLTLRQDPRSKHPQEDLEAQVAFGNSLTATVTRLSRAVARIRSLQQQLADREQLTEAVLGDQDNGEQIRSLSADLLRRLEPIEESLYNPKAEVNYDILAMPGGARLYSRLTYLLLMVQEAEGAPTQGMLSVRESLMSQLESQLQALETLLSAGLGDLNRELQGAGLPTVLVPKVIPDGTILPPAGKQASVD